MVTRLTRSLSVLLLIAGLVLLQIPLLGSGLAFELPPFALLALAALVGVWAFAPESRADPFCLAAATLFGGYVLVRAFGSPSPYHGRIDACLALAAFAVYGLTASALTRPRLRMAVVATLLAFAVVHVFVSVVQFGIGHNFILVPALEQLAPAHAAPGQHSRASGFYASPDHLAGLLEVLGIFALSLACWSRWPRSGRVIMGYLALICYLGVAFTGSRGGYLSVAASVVAFAVLSLIALRSGGASLFWKWAAIGLIFLSAAGVGGNLLLQKSATLTQRLGNVAAIDQGRLDLWNSAVEQWKLQPWMGTGGGTYRFYARQFRAEGMQQDPIVAHNDYLQLLAEYGGLGAAGFLLFLGLHLRRGWRGFLRSGPQRIAGGQSPLSDRLALTIAALSALAGFAVHSAVDFNLHIPANAMLLAFVFGLLANPGTTLPVEPPAGRMNFVPRLATGAVAAFLLVQCIRLFPGEYHGYLARVALNADDPAQALEQVTRALAHEQSNPRLYFVLGRAQAALAGKATPEERQVRLETALTAFESARRLDPLDGNHALDLALVYDDLGRFAEAEWMYEIARERDPRSISVANMYRAHLRRWGKM